MRITPQDPLDYLRMPQTRDPNSAKRENPALQSTTMITAKKIRTTPMADTSGIQPLDQNSNTTVEMTRFFCVASVSAMVTSRYESMASQIQLLKIPAAISGAVMLATVCGVES